MSLVRHKVSTVSRLGGFAVLGAVLLVSRVALAQLPPLDLFPPAYPTGAAVEKRITDVTRYRYALSVYQPLFTVEAMAPGVEGFASPEQIMLSRVSAMMNADYDRFLSYWDGPGLESFEETNSAMGRGRDYYLGQWSGFFASTRAVMVARIDIADYTVIGWGLKKIKGDKAMGVFVPTVFHRVGERWLATQDLQDFPMMSLVAGETEQEEVVR